MRRGRCSTSLELTDRKVHPSANRRHETGVVGTPQSSAGYRPGFSAPKRGGGLMAGATHEIGDLYNSLADKPIANDEQRIIIHMSGVADPCLDRGQFLAREVRHSRPAAPAEEDYPGKEGCRVETH